MKTKYIQILGIVLIVAGFVFIAFIYSTKPRSLTDVTTNGLAAVGAYEIDKKEFDTGLASFRHDDFVAARAAFLHADPMERDANTQFHIAYSYYRQGWGRLYNDDTLFSAGRETVKLVIILDSKFRTTDDNLQIKTPAELKNEFDEGLKITPSDFNPMKLTRERK